MLKASNNVKIALKLHETTALNQTPFKPNNIVIINNAPIGNTNVPKKEVIIERIGLSNAVKNDEKHISTHPVI